MSFIECYRKTTLSDRELTCVLWDGILLLPGADVYP